MVPIIIFESKQASIVFDCRGQSSKLWSASIGYSILFLVEIWALMSVIKSATMSELTSVLAKDVAAMSCGLSQDRNTLVLASQLSTNQSMSPTLSVHLNKSDVW